MGYGLTLKEGGTVRDVELYVTGNNVVALSSLGDTSISAARIVVGSADRGLFQHAGTMTVSRTTIEGSGGSSTGVETVTPGAIVQASRLVSRGVRSPLRAMFGGSLAVRDSLLFLPAGVSATALEVGDHNNPTNFTSTLAAERVTLVGDPGISQTGAGVFADSGGDDFAVSLHDSVLVGVKTSLHCSSTAGTGSATADWSSLPGGDWSDGVGCTVARTNPVAGPRSSSTPPEATTTSATTRP